MATNMNGPHDAQSYQRITEMFAHLEKLGLTADEIMLYTSVQQAAKNAHSLPELRQNERDDFVRDFQRILERILARAGLRALGHAPKVPPK